MPVTEIDKKNQSLDQQSQSEQSQSQSQSQPSSSQSLQQQEDSQQLPDAEDIESTNNLIDSLTTQQQQEQLFNKLQQLHQLRNQDFVSDDEITQSHITDNSTYYGPLHDKFFFHSQSQPQHHQHHHQRYQTLSQQQNKLLLSEDGSNGIDSEQNTLCPVIHNGSSTFNLAPENADQEHKHDIELQLHLKQQQQQQEKEAEEEKRRRQQQQERELSLNNQVRKGYSLDYFDQFNNVHNGINNYQASVFDNRYLQPNSLFIGEQQSGKASFHIKVEFKTVDLFNSMITGFLQINGLTDKDSEITTYFKGEIINNPLNHFILRNNNIEGDSDVGVNSFENPSIQKYSFVTENKQWGSFAKNDYEHWKKLTQSTTFLSDEELIKRLEKVQRGEQDDQYIYMRWKEEFLLPDSRIKQITGASFEGFYYIVLNIGGGGNNNNGRFGKGRSLSTSSSASSSSSSSSLCDGLLPGGISGLYYHKSSEKFQSLSLRHVDDKVDVGTFDFV